MPCRLGNHLPANVVNATALAIPATLRDGSDKQDERMELDAVISCQAG
jgi:hypothetical protein